VTATKRGRPRGFDRDAALAQATRLFWEQGYEATSVGELTRVMGIRPPSLYAAFGDKRELFEEVVRSYGATFGAFTARALEEEPTARRGFTRLLHETAEAYADPAHPAGCLIITAAANCSDEQVRSHLRELRNGNLAVFEQRLDAGVRAGELPPDTDVRILASYFAAVIQGMSQRARDGADTPELRALADVALSCWPAGDRDT